MTAKPLDDAALTRQLAALIGWEVVGPEIAADYGETYVYIDLKGCYYRKTDKGWAEWRPLHDMNDAWMVVERLHDLGYGTITVCSPDKGQPIVSIWLSVADEQGEYATDAHGNYVRTAIAATPQRAIALAALAALAALPKEGE